MNKFLIQQEVIIKELHRKGYVTRNWAIREKYITRLSAIIYNLKDEGFHITGEYIKTINGRDYQYNFYGQRKPL